jgi:4-alpha-glucanotransferase
MGLYRLYWIPEGARPTEGAYVRYPAEELFAVLALEAHRHGIVVVGEDLGTVPSEVRRLMDRHGVGRSYVVQFSLRPDQTDPLAPPEPGTFAGVNTHDMPPFAAFWKAEDVGDRLAMGLLDDDEAERERTDRARIREALLAHLVAGGWVEPLPDGIDLHGDEAGRRALVGCLAVLAAGDARVVVVNLEDLWGETRPQNVPGTSSEERPNWRGAARYGFDTFRRDPGVRSVLEMVDRLRRRGAR